MSAHSEIEAHLGRKGVTYSSATAGCTTVAAGAASFDHKDLAELERVCAAEGYELLFTAGALKIRPKNSAL